MGTSFYGTPERKKARALAYKLSQGRCSNCRREVKGLHQARVDHKIPRKQRPDLALVQSNLRVLCTYCDAARHSEKGGKQKEKEEINANGYPQAWA